MWDGALTFKLPQGVSSQSGIFAAELAKSGWNGPTDALFSKFGYYYYYGIKLDPEILTRDLGKKYYQDGYIKRFPCCQATHGPIACTLALVAKHDIKAEDIKEVTIKLPARSLGDFCNKPFVVRELPQCSAIYSFRYTTASALLRKSVKLEHFTEEAIREPQVNDIINKINVAELPRAEGERVQVKVKMKGGQEFSETDVPIAPMSKDDIVTKFKSNIEYAQIITKKNSDKLLNMLENLEEVDDVKKIVRLSVG
jgi:2-methylcitrate dehydratase PrpD